MAVPARIPDPKPTEFPPAPEKRTVRLPGGGSLIAVADLPRSVEEQCQVSLKLFAQIGPFLGSMECLIRVLKFCGWLLDFVKAVSNPIAIAQQLEKLPPIAADLLECITAWTPVGYCSFIKDVLQTILDFLRCTLEVLHSVVDQKLEIQIAMGDAQGNPELLEVLQVAQDNADKVGAQAAQSCAPVFALLETVGSLLEALGVGVIAVPSPNDLTGRTIDDETLQPLDDLVSTLDAIVKALPC